MLGLTFINYQEQVMSIHEAKSRGDCPIIGDIHGCYDELRVLLDEIEWSPQSHILILTGYLIDRGLKIKETLIFAMNTPSVYSLMANHEQKLLRYLRGRRVHTTPLVKTIEQCGEPFLKGSSFLKWLESLLGS